MANVQTLEARLSRNLGSGSPDDFDHVSRHYWQLACVEDDYRTRQKLLKKSSHYAGRAFDSGIENPDTLRLYMDIVREAALVHSFPQDERRKLAQVTARWLSVTGADKHTVVGRAKGKVALETATFGLGDVGLTPDETEQPSFEGQMVEWMSKGQRLFFGTGYDGVLNAEIRAVDGAEPVLSPKEYKKLTSSTPTIVLTAPTGQFALADYALMTKPWSSQPEWDSVVIEVSPGNYKVCAYGFWTNRRNSVIAVLCRTNQMPPNTVSTVDSLFM